VAPCSRCGTFLCGDCTEVVDEAAWCADCMEWLRRNGPTSRLVKWCIGLGIAGIVLSPLCTILGLVINAVVGGVGVTVSTRELRRIRRGEGPLRGTMQAHVARVLAVVNLLLALLWLAGIVYWFFGDAFALLRDKPTQ
jgi:hypothetical protein